METKLQKWKDLTAEQVPDYDDQDAYNEVINKLEKLPALVFSGETRRLKESLKDVHTGQSFILQIGNCSESFADCHGPLIHNFLRVFLQMSAVLGYDTNKRIIKIGRIAGQYAKPRSRKYELLNGKELPVYRGDIINDVSPTESARKPDPNRMLEAYFRSTATLNLIRAFIQGGYADIKNFSDWKNHFFAEQVVEYENFHQFEDDLSKSLKSESFIKSISKGDEAIFTSHEALLLDYEDAFTRLDTTHGGFYNTSAHFLWLGDRTRQLDHAHVEYLSSIENPIGVKVGPNYDIKEIEQVIRRLNPNNETGKLILISRMGKLRVEEKLEPLISMVKRNSFNVIWCCDPMHGNTYGKNNFKVRSLDDIIMETRLFFRACLQNNVIPGGIHLEVSGDNVTECVGGINKLTYSDLEKNYQSKVDPRLNASQAIELAFHIRRLLNLKNENN